MLSPYVIRYGMYPHKEWAGHAEARVLKDGRIHYDLFFFPYGSSPRELVVDPANVEHIRGLKQLHLVPELR